MPDLVDWLHRQGAITDLDLHFTRFITARADGPGPELALGVCLASHWTGNGNVCVGLRTLAGQPLFADRLEREPPLAPPLDAWRRALRRSAVVGRPGDFQPLILDRRDRLYLYRYWDHERRLAADLLSRARIVDDPADDARLGAELERLFGASDERHVDWQRAAAAVALTRRLCVISGGPGTGKTHTVVRILALLLGSAPANPLRIALAAPTGKAAARVQDSIRRSKATLDLPPPLAAMIPDRAQTLHRLLGPLPDGVGFRHDRDRPLPLDVLIVDEASMIDLALMARLVEALPSAARLILLGDKDQLASVEAGAVLGDICGRVPGPGPAFRQRLQRLAGASLPAGRRSRSPLADCVVQLRHSRRFGSRSGIGRLARAVNRGDAGQALRILVDPATTDVGWQRLAGVSVNERLTLRLADGYGEYLRLLQEGAGADRISTAFDRFRVLCALRRGPFGVAELNRLIERELRRRRLIPPAQTAPWYPGRPVLVTRNDYRLGLYNGDIGLTLPDAEGRLRVRFAAPDGDQRMLAPGRLPAHETVYAMTVHKSQGSEFDRVLLILPPADSRALGRELLYTGITRARRRVELWASEAALRTAIGRRTERASGLEEALWRGPATPTGGGDLT
ncbi:MAG: exodeoxyribonuclease V subunit alpha [Candidatus Competibacterales bacterium]|nr:exodeoxyribonuclease V subunit alpha [Candidatus Competibacterales bacterium]